MDIDAKIELAKKLIQEREAIDAQLAALFNGGEMPAKRAGPRTTSAQNPKEIRGRTPSRAECSEEGRD